MEKLNKAVNVRAFFEYYSQRAYVIGLYCEGFKEPSFASFDIKIY